MKKTTKAKANHAPSDYTSFDRDCNMALSLTACRRNIAGDSPLHCLRDRARGDYRAAVCLARSFNALGLQDDAIEWAMHAADLEPAHASLWSFISQVQIERGDQIASLEAMQKWATLARNIRATHSDQKQWLQLLEFALPSMLELAKSPSKLELQRIRLREIALIFCGGRGGLMFIAFASVDPDQIGHMQVLQDSLTDSGDNWEVIESPVPDVPCLVVHRLPGTGRYSAEEVDSAEHLMHSSARNFACEFEVASEAEFRELESQENVR